ncbi:MAG: nickel insertion protein [Chloroflexota bacterium]
MRVAYFDCFAGLSGEMLLGALVGSGLSLEALNATLSALPLLGYSLDSQMVARKEHSGTYLRVAHTAASLQVSGRTHVSNGHSPQASPQSATPESIITDSRLPNVIKQTSLAIFGRLRRAEAAVFPHNSVAAAESFSPEAVITVIGVVTALALLGINRVECSPLQVGTGITRTAGGIGPSLSPMTAEILRTAAVPVYGSQLPGELVTPVGAAIMVTVASAWGPIPAMKIGSVGYGAGKDDLVQTPNLVRLFIGETNGDIWALTTGHQSGILTPTQADHVSPVAKQAEAVHAEVEVAASNSRPYIAKEDEWVALTIKGHQQSGRQRLAS